MPLTEFEQHAGNPVEKIFWGRAKIRAASAYLYFTKNSAVQQSLHRFKYKGRKEIGFYFGKRIGHALKSSGRFQTCELILPLPLFTARARKRGYNQAAILSEGISAVTNIPVINDALVRVMETATQTHKTRIQRWQNMTDKFMVKKPELLIGKHILLVDDVITTGSTLDACAQILLSTQEVTLSIATLAYSVSG
ncbi:MAG: phosphoribosyltransferase family protein [Bacteroidota bacterium]|nr:phosphoribosyltransferase family protein [Bacteroidota bacterium]MDP4212195.1 phosphoribosyltransferase family protein [Bacteroidota bacterium]MDP4249055.1 phosphoribosyltransferase family protein [Bacteroidota bacterium]